MPHTDNRTLLRSIAQSAAEGFRVLSIAADGHNDTVGGAQVWYCSSAVPVFNGAAIFEEQHLNPDTVRGIAEYFISKGRPYSLLIVDGLVQGAAEKLNRLNYFQYEQMPAMYLEGPPVLWTGSAVEELPDLWVSQVTSTGDLAIFREILSTVFFIAQDEIALVLGDSTLEVPNMRHYLGWLDGQPVATLSLVTSGPIPGIWNVGTLREQRRKGVGAAMMRAAISQLQQEGYSACMLLASTDGLPLYYRLGYRTVSVVRIFVQH